MNTSNSKKTRLKKEFCIKVLTSTSLVLNHPCMRPPTISYYNCIMYDFVVDKD